MHTGLERPSRKLGKETGRGRSGTGCPSADLVEKKISMLEAAKTRAVEAAERAKSEAKAAAERAVAAASNASARMSDSNLRESIERQMQISRQHCSQ